MKSERIKILQEAGLINEAAASFADNAESLLKNRYPENSEAINVFVTHLAMAAQRIQNEEPVEQAEDVVWEEVRNSEHCHEAGQLLQEILLQAPCNIPESECRFLIIHLCNILNS